MYLAVQYSFVCLKTTNNPRNKYSNLNYIVLSNYAYVIPPFMLKYSKTEVHLPLYF